MYTITNRVFFFIYKQIFKRNLLKANPVNYFLIIIYESPAQDENLSYILTK